ncbi:hypothetical protein KCP74_24135 [Salmonella enterica subsp. enterica]|nr:hypothetical protein KCP74_24135 [Salmonella enterica subsp. enterica]
MPWSLPVGMCFTPERAGTRWQWREVLWRYCSLRRWCGYRSSVFTELPRVARISPADVMVLAQSIFGVSGNFGSSLGPLRSVIIAPCRRGMSHSLCWPRCCGDRGAGADQPLVCGPAGQRASQSDK